MTTQKMTKLELDNWRSQNAISNFIFKAVYE